MNVSLRQTRLIAWVCGLTGLAGIVSAIAGAVVMHVEGRETGFTAPAIGLGLFLGIMGPAGLYVCLRSLRVVQDVIDGKNVMARWTVSAADVDAFRAWDARRNEKGPAFVNGWTPPDPAPAEGIEVIVVPDGVMVHGAYFQLVNTGISTFFGPQWLQASPPSLEFGTLLIMVTGGTSTNVRRDVAALRVPFGQASMADAMRVLNHFRQVDAREIVVNAGFYKGRMKAGLWVLPIGSLVAAAGFGLDAIEARFALFAPHLAPLGINLNDDVTDLMVVLGALLALAGAALHAAARYLSYRQHRR